MLRPHLGLFLLPLALVACGGGGGGDDPGGGNNGGNTTVSFQRDILTVFQSECTRCHGGAGGLQLDTYADLMAGGNSGPVVIDGDPENSILVQRLEDPDPDERMPLMSPALSDNEIETIKQWIREGAQNN